MDIRSFYREIALTGHEKVGPPAVASSGGYDLSRLNAVRHGVLSKYMVLPWEDELAYRQLLDALAEEHHPKGETEHYLVEQLANIMWRKRRLSLAEMALNHEMQKRVIDAGERDALGNTLQSRPGSFTTLSGTSDQQKQNYLSDLDAYRGQTLKAAELLKSSSQKAFEQGLTALPPHAQEWWRKRYPEVLPPFPDPFPSTTNGLLRFVQEKVLPWCDRCRGALEERSMVNAKAFEAALDSGGLEKLDRYEIALDRKFERTLAMLMKFQELHRVE